jgi:hypothetical protein
MKLLWNKKSTIFLNHNLTTETVYTKVVGVQKEYLLILKFREESSALTNIYISISKCRGDGGGQKRNYSLKFFNLIKLETHG